MPYCDNTQVSINRSIRFPNTLFITCIHFESIKFYKKIHVKIIPRTGSNFMEKLGYCQKEFYKKLKVNRLIRCFSSNVSYKFYMLEFFRYD